MSADRTFDGLDAQTLLEHAPCGYVVTSLDGTIVQVNEPFIDLSGLSRDVLLGGKRFTDLLSVPSRIYYETHLGPLLLMQGFVHQVTLDVLRPNRAALPVLMNATRFPAEKPSAILMTIVDSTDRRTYERELLLARQQAEEARQSERHQRELAEEAGRLKDAFLASVSHELRTPLSAILGWTQILKRNGGLTPEQLNGMTVIENNAKVQTQLINDLLDVSRIIGGKMRLHVREVRVAEVIEAALNTVRPSAEAKDIELLTVLDPSVTVLGDPERLQQVFWNLLSNSIKFTPKHGVVRVAMFRVNSHVEIRVIDNGAGMTDAFIARAFERASQADSDATQKSGGLGLGLSIVKSLIEMHGGTISAASDGLGKGSTFLMNLPVSALQSRRDGPEEAVHPVLSDNAFEVRGITLKGVKVAVVEDDPDSRDMLKQLLKSAGAVVETAASVGEALALLEKMRPDVLVSDIGLPGEDGFSLIRKVRMAGESIGNVRAVALTAFAEAGTRTQAMLAGFQMHLAKPVDARELIVTVATLAMK